jgi:hypothetical protein
MNISTIACTALITALSLPACVISTDGDSSFTVENESDYAIFEAYIAEESSPSWGPELLGGVALLPGERLEVFDLDCGTYDALIYDEIGAECELNHIDLCFDDAYWVIDNAALSNCPVFR